MPAAKPSRPEDLSFIVPVLAAAVGAAVLFAVGAYYLGPPSASLPPNLTLVLQAPYFAGSIATVTVSYASTPTSPQALLLSLSVNGSTGAAVPMPTNSGDGAGVAVTAAGYPFRLDWIDADHDAMLSTYDSFRVVQTLSPPRCCLYQEFHLLSRADGSLIAQAYFYGPPAPAAKPAVAFGNVSRGTSTNVFFTLAYVEPAASPSYLYFQIAAGYDASPLTPLGTPYSPSRNVSVGGGEYIVAWYDSNYDQLVSEYDGFNVTLVAGSWPTPGTPMSFTLAWEDGATLATATWTA
jgi:hypothetical protein